MLEISFLKFLFPPHKMSPLTSVAITYLVIKAIE